MWRRLSRSSDLRTGRGTAPRTFGRSAAARRHRKSDRGRSEALLCDEPTGDLDRATADEILGTLQLLNRQLGKTIIMVTHDAAAAKFAKRTLHLDKGKFNEQELAA